MRCLSRFFGVVALGVVCACGGGGPARRRAGAGGGGRLPLDGARAGQRADFSYQFAFKISC